MHLLDDWRFIVGATLAGFIIGMSRGGFAGGIAFVGVLIMAQFTEPVVAAAFVLPLLCLIDPFSTYVYRRYIDWSSIKAIIPGALAGIGIGTAVFYLINANMIRLFVCVLALYVLLDRLTNHVRKISDTQGYRWPMGSLLGVITGFSSFIIHAGHPSLSAYLLPKKLPREVFVGTCALFYAIINYIKLIPYALLGILDLSLFTTAAVFFPVTLGGFATGRWLIRHISDRRFYQVMYVSIAAMSLKLAYDGLRGLGLW